MKIKNKKWTLLCTLIGILLSILIRRSWRNYLSELQYFLITLLPTLGILLGDYIDKKQRNINN
jgi:uncharacterized membrane protein